MLTRMDRVQAVVADRKRVAEAYARLLGAQEVGEDSLASLAARRTILRVGQSEVDLLEPDGAGAVADFLARMRGGLFAAGFSTPDVAALRRRLDERGVRFAAEGESLFLEPESLGIAGLRVSVAPERERPPAGLLRGLYEVTLLTPHFEQAAARLATVFGLEREHFVPIRSEPFGYEGLLTLLHPDRLDRIEAITPSDATKTMGRFFARLGEVFYMAFAESHNLGVIEERARECRAGYTAEPRPEGDPRPPDTLFLHPPVLGGMMLGISGPDIAWRWSGQPERVPARNAAT